MTSSHQLLLFHWPRTNQSHEYHFRCNNQRIRPALFNVPLPQCNKQRRADRAGLWLTSTAGREAVGAPVLIQPLSANTPSLPYSCSPFKARRRKELEMPVCRVCFPLLLLPSPSSSHCTRLTSVLSLAGAAGQRRVLPEQPQSPEKHTPKRETLYGQPHPHQICAPCPTSVRSSQRPSDTGGGGRVLSPGRREGLVAILLAACQCTRVHTFNLSHGGKYRLLQPVADMM